MAGGEGALAGSVIGAHQVGELIGTGPLAEVYLSRHPGLQQPVALKVFAPIVATDAIYVETIREGAARIRTLEVDHILPVYDFGRDGESLFISMPLMSESLRALLQRVACLPLYRAVPLLRQIAFGLAAAHSADIIHRDLKPENVLLDASGKAFVSDFGIGRDLPPEGMERRSLGTLSSLIGTPAYMAPEQLRGQPTDQRADVYALGVIFYEMLTGVTPFSGSTIYEVAAQALTKKVPPPSQHVAGIPPLVERAMLRALARDPAARWPTVQRFMMGLNAALPTHANMPGESEPTPNGPVYVATPPQLPPAVDSRVPGITGEASSDDDPTIKTHDQAISASRKNGESSESSMDTTSAFDLSTSSAAIPVPDLRLFRVDPLPPQPKNKWTAWVLLMGVALLLLSILIVGGALLADAAQSPRNAAPAISTPTRFHNSGAGVTPAFTTRPTATIAPKPTATRRPTPTATPQPTATATSTPVPAATSATP